MTKIYKVKLTPVGQFFFGGEIVFGVEGAQNERQRSYLVHSNTLPQQTSILGMLREQLLRQNDCLLSAKSSPKKVDEAIELVGKQGFSATNKVHNYGVIQELSPLVLEDKAGNYWQPAPKDDRLMDDQAMIFRYDATVERPLLENYKPKKGLPLCFENKAFERKELSDFFKQQTQVGITVTNRRKGRKDYKPEENEDAFYRQTFLKNKPKAPQAFTFWVALDRTKDFKIENALVTLGGERSTFQMEISESTEASIEAHFQPTVYQHTQQQAAEMKQLVLMSDCYMNAADLKKYSIFQVMETVPFRYFTTTLGKTTHYYDFKKSNENGRQQSDLLTLIQRGSVLYFRSTEEANLKNAIDQHIAFRTIGYNYYKIVN